MLQTIGDLQRDQPGSSNFTPKKLREQADRSIASLRA
jgi:hypothetical protein